MDSTTTTLFFIIGGGARTVSVQSKEYRGILLAGGKATRLFPVTRSISKQLLPVYNKPLIYYPLSTLMLAGVREILVIHATGQGDAYRELLGDGSSLGIRIEYAEQAAPEGIAQALTIGEKFIKGANVILALGDNLIYGDSMPNWLQAAKKNQGATIFAYQVRDPERYGVAEFDKEHRVISLEEKPARPRSNWAVLGLYFFDEQAINFAKELRPSTRGELEITDLNQKYLNQGTLRVQPLGRGVAWFDAGTHDSLLQASNFVQTIEQRQGLQVACLEEIAFRHGYIDEKQLARIIDTFSGSNYGEYLGGLLQTT